MLKIVTSPSLNLMMSAFSNVQTPLRVASKSGCSWLQQTSGTPMAGALPLSHKTAATKTWGCHVLMSERSYPMKQILQHKGEMWVLDTNVNTTLDLGSIYHLHVFGHDWRSTPPARTKHFHCIEWQVRLLAIVCEVQWDGLRTLWFLQLVLMKLLTIKLFMKIPHIFSTASWVVAAWPFIYKLPFKNLDVPNASVIPQTKEQIDQQRECQSIGKKTPGSCCFAAKQSCLSIPL